MHMKQKCLAAALHHGGNSCSSMHMKQRRLAAALHYGGNSCCSCNQQTMEDTAGAVHNKLSIAAVCRAAAFMAQRGGRGSMRDLQASACFASFYL